MSPEIKDLHYYYRSFIDSLAVVFSLSLDLDLYIAVSYQVRFWDS